MATNPPEPRPIPRAVPPDDGPQTEVVDRLVEEMADAWYGGARPRAEEYVARLANPREEDVVRLVYEEACLRQDDGEEGVSAEVLGRFPQYRSRLALLFDCNRLLRTPPAIDFPEPGDDLGDFRLVAEIGRGALGRTYLASQQSLANRLIVLKVTPLGHEEHLSLARLQHMHIVPLYFEQSLPDRNLRVLGMPYLGGATLARVLYELLATPARLRLAGDLLEALDHSALALPTEFPVGGPFRKYLEHSGYIRAICWIGACLADALQYAHDRGLIHLDVKPSNVLIAGDGQPMLLDFHLARGPIGPGLAVPDRLGGTPGYLSPEQQSAMAAIRAGEEPAVAVDGRSDLYSLGLLLHEALSGVECFTNRAGKPLLDSRPRLDACNPRVSPGLADIIHKCLEPDARDRYPDAASLAIDLRRHNNDLPLRGVKNRSPVERWRKWRRRHPAALSHGVLRLATVVAVAAVVAASVVYYVRLDRQVDAALAEGVGHVKAGRYAEATLALDRGLKLAGHLTADDRRKTALNDNLRLALRARAAAELHDLVNRVRFRSGIGTTSGEEARPLLALGRKLWNSRDLITRPGDEPLDRGTEAQVVNDLLDLATAWADLRVHSAPAGETDEALRDAVDLLLEAESRFGPSPALSRDLRDYARDLGRTDIPGIEIPAPRSAWEHYALGRSYLRSGEYGRALVEFQRAVAMQPDEFWPYFSQAACEYHLGRYQGAVASLTVCVALAPKSAECHYNRAVAFEALNQPDRASADYTRALALSPGFSDAALNRAILSIRAGRYPDAAADLRRAHPSARVPADYAEALARLEVDDWPSARASLRRAASQGDPAARRLCARLGLE